jgi:hypothetical protein
MEEDRVTDDQEEKPNTGGIPPDLMFRPVPRSSRRLAITLLIFILSLFALVVILAFSGVFGSW